MIYIIIILSIDFYTIVWNTKLSKNVVLFGRIFISFKATFRKLAKMFADNIFIQWTKTTLLQKNDYFVKNKCTDKH